MPKLPLTKEELRAKRLIRFWRCVDRRNDMDCWNWLGPLNRSGYGLFSLWSLEDRGKVIIAHRLSYELHNGPIPKGNGAHGTVIAHRCDNRRCVNPSHLFACTQAENLRDCLKKGRGNKAAGEKAGRAKLSEQAVKAIRKLIEEGTDRQKLSRAFGVTPQTISDIADLKSWARSSSAIVGPLPLVKAERDYSDCKPNSGSFKPGSKGNPGPKPEMRTANYERIASLLESGMSQREIARVCGTTHPTVRRVANTLGKEMANPFRRMTEQDRELIREYSEKGYSQQEIADLTGVSRPTVSRTLSGSE
jgi:DNA invertase Pin-like site-specific DNA recombinase